MITITAIIRVIEGKENVMREALLKVADNVRNNEPDTQGFYMCQDRSDPCVFTTYERFVDEAAMDAHNNSPTVAAFFAVAKPLLDGDVILLTCEELFAK